ncbi:TonB-dependent receptor [Gilvimarinus sp. F26214L]|uniref:TonB-dependent receptor n=1 Tax=Gilvimarinus sp. DZF01 TaxID=3461371 RepID=UPI0040463384
MRMPYLVSTLLLAPSLATVAQTPSIDEIVTTAQRRDAQFDTAGNIARLNQETLEQIGHLHIQDALVRVPGVSFHQGDGQEYLPSIRSAVMSGAGACGAFLTAQDGVPLRAAGFCNINELFEAYTEQAARVEVVRGPGNALYGSNALHGVINVIMPSVPAEAESRFGVELGSNDYRREDFYYGTRSGDQGVLVNLTTTHDGGWRDDAYYDQQKLQLRHEVELDNWSITTTFAATNLNQETAGYIEGYKAYEDDDLITTNQNPEAYRDAQSFRLYSRMARQVSDTQSFVITPYVRKTEMEFLQHFLPQTPLEENGQDSAGFMFTWYDDVSNRVQWLAGFDAELTDGWLRETQSAPTMGPFPTGRHYDFQVDALQMAPFAQLTWGFADRWRLTAGLRYEIMRYDYDNKMIAGNTAADGTPCAPADGCRYSRPADRKDDFDNWSPQVGLLFDLTESQQLFVNVANGFRAPQATELYRLQGGQQIAHLDPEEVLSLELGARGGWDGFRYQFSIYAMEKENVIFRDTNLRNNLGDGETDHLGVELELGYQLSERWDLGLVANYAEHEYANDQSLSRQSIAGNQEDSAPRHFGTAHLGWQIGGGARAELELVHMGSYYTDPENRHHYDGHDLLNLRSQWDVSKAVRLSLNILNLTDENYANRADWTGFGGDRYFPGQPRSAYFGVDLRF